MSEKRKVAALLPPLVLPSVMAPAPKEFALEPRTVPALMTRLVVASVTLRVFSVPEFTMTVPVPATDPRLISSERL